MLSVQIEANQDVDAISEYITEADVAANVGNEEELDVSLLEVEDTDDVHHDKVNRNKNISYGTPIGGKNSKYYAHPNM